MIPAPSAVARTRSAPQTALDVGLRACDRLLAEHVDAVRARFGQAGLGLVDLPELGPEPLVAAQIRLGAALYWCREVERSGVLPMVEALARELEQGVGGWTITSGAFALRPFWRGGEHRFVAEERRAIYAQVFRREGAGVTQGFDVWFGLLVEALTEIGAASVHDALLPMQVRAATLAIDVGRELTDHAVGIVGFATRDIVGQIRAAIDALSDPDVTMALGGGAPVQLVARHAPRLLGHAVDPWSHAARAAHGAAIIRWIADGANDLHLATRSLGPNASVVHDAGAWRAASGGHAR
jgi:hypothetical protein